MGRVSPRTHMYSLIPKGNSPQSLKSSQQKAQISPAEIYFYFSVNYAEQSATTDSSLPLFLPPSLSLLTAQVPDNDEQFVPDFHSENCKYHGDAHTSWGRGKSKFWCLFPPCSRQFPPHKLKLNTFTGCSCFPPFSELGL